MPSPVTLGAPRCGICALVRVDRSEYARMVNLIAPPPKTSTPIVLKPVREKVMLPPVSGVAA